MPVELESVCRKCLHKNPEDRYASAEAVADDLERWLRGETPIMHPIGRMRRLFRWANRRPMLVSLWSAVILLLVFGVGTLAWHIRAMREAAYWNKLQLYVISVRLAARYIEMKQLDRAAETLDKCPDQTEWGEGAFAVGSTFRGWDWHYLKRLCHREEIRLRGHAASVLSVEYNPDGSRIATAGLDRTVRIWNAATGQQLHTLRGHESFVNNACFSNGGRLLISASADGAVKFWDVATGRELQGLPIKGNQIAVSRRNNVLAALNRDHSIGLWDVVARKNLWSLTGLKERITNIALSPDGRYLAAVGYQEVLRVWDLHERRELPPFIGAKEPIPQRIMFGIAFSSDGNYLVVGSENPRIWNLHTRKAIRVYGTGGLRCSRMVFSPDNKWVAAICRDGLVRVWDIESETIVLSLDKAADQDVGLAFSPDGHHLALSRGWEVGIIQNINNPVLQTHRVLEGHSALQVGALAFSPDGRRFASRAGEREIILWDAANGRVLRTLVAPRKIPSEANLTFSPDGSRLFSGCRGDQLLVWDVKKGQRSADTIPAPNTLCCVFDPTGQWLATTDGLEILLWNAESKELIRRFDRDTSEISCLAFRPGHRQLASCGSDGLAKLWDMDAGKVVRTFKAGTTHAIAWIAFNPDGRRMATAGHDLTVRCLGCRAQGDPLILKGHNGPITRVAFSPDGSRIVSASYDGTVKLWDAHLGQELLTFKKNKKGSVACVAFSPDGRLLAAGSHDGTLRVWDGTPLSITQQP